jgi:hypothetical protein
MKVRHLSDVDREISDAISYYLAEETLQSAERLDIMIQEAEGAISREPFLFPIIDEKVRFKLLTPFPFSLLYSIEESEIIIIALAHQKRKPGYWRNRL